MVDRSVLQKRLEKLKNYIELLKYIGKQKKDEYVRNPLIHGNGERYLHLAAECVIDIGNHIVSDQGFGTPGPYREIFQILADNAIFEPKLAAKMQDFASMRNILVHDYLQVDHGRTYDAIKSELIWLEKFIEAIETFL